VPIKALPDTKEVPFLPLKESMATVPSWQDKHSREARPGEWMGPCRVGLE